MEQPTRRRLLDVLGGGPTAQTTSGSPSAAARSTVVEATAGRPGRRRPVKAVVSGEMDVTVGAGVVVEK